MPDLEAIGLAAVDRFIETWNSRDAGLWASSLNYPHVRPGAQGPINVADTAEIYASRMDYSRVIATGWDHSEWDYRHVLQTSGNKIHVAGQWSRYNAAGEIIHTNPIVYVVTHNDGEWGIQSRFAADYAGEDADTTALEGRAMKLLQDFVTNYNSNRQQAAAELLNYPHFSIGVGELQRHDAAADFQLQARAITIQQMHVVQAGRLSANLALDLGITDGENDRAYQAVMNITDRDGHLGIQAWSLLDPNALADDDQAA